MATINIGRLKFVWQGAYSNSTAYVPDDIVSYSGSSYVCTANTTGNLPTDTTYWSVMAQSGTDITSLAGLSQGDILYYNGTDWVRLGAGTSGQVLQTGGTGANPSWGTISSDFVKLGETGTLSNVSDANLNGFFSSDYKVYKIFGFNTYGGATGSAFSWRANTGGSYTAQGTNYFHASDGYYVTSSGNGHDYRTDWDDTSGCHIGWVGGGSGRENNWELTLYDPQSTTKYKFATHSVACWNGTTKWVGMTGAGTWRNTTAMTGIQFLAIGGNLYADNIVMYGIKA